MEDQSPYDIDREDSDKLWAFSLKTCQIAEDYKLSREKYGSALKHLKLKLAVAYKNKTIERGIAQDKALIVLTINDKKAKLAFEAVIIEEQVYKGLEKVLEARQSVMSFNQSLIKNQLRNT